jgi:hypothetical protein
MHSTTIEALAQFPQQLEKHFSAIPKDQAHWKPQSWDGIPSEPYSAIEQLCHVRDIEIDGYQVRIQRTLDEDNSFLPSIDGDKLARDLAYASADADQVLAQIRGARAKTVRLLGDLSAAQFERTAHFEGYGDVTLRGVMHYWCSHDQQHLAGLQWLLGKMAAAMNRA